MGGIAQSKSSQSQDDIFNEENYHCDTIDQYIKRKLITLRFIQIFAKLPEVKDAIAVAVDEYGYYS
jgi:hypothetical protein